MTSSEPRRRRSSKLWPVAAAVLTVAVTACGGGSKSPTVPNAGALSPTTASAPAGTTADRTGSTSGATTELAKAQAYAQCMRSHGVTNFPDPVVTPSGGYGFRTRGVDPHSAAFQSGTEACNALVPGGWGGPGKQLTPAQQQQWLTWAACVRGHGVPDFADPTFPGGGAVQIAGGGPDSSPQLQSAMAACKSKMPTTGGLGG